MKKFSSLPFITLLMVSCGPHSNIHSTEMQNSEDSLTYPYQATHASDLTIPAKPEVGQVVLTIWKMFENKQIDSLKKYYADTVSYENAEGNLFHGPADSLLLYAKSDVQGLDSLRFDISFWQSLHINSKNEDWVYIWASERRYSKGGKADTTLIHEQWKVENGRVTYFNQYTRKPPKK